MFLGFFAWYHGLAVGPITQVAPGQDDQPVLSICWAGLLGEQAAGATIVGGLVVILCAGAAVRVRLGTTTSETDRLTVRRAGPRRNALPALPQSVAGMSDARAVHYAALMDRGDGGTWQWPSAPVCEQVRQSRRWTLDQLAGAAGVSRRMVVNVEQGAANPSVGTLLRISDALGVGLPSLVEHPRPSR